MTAVCDQKMHHSKIHCEQPDAESLSCYQTYRTTPAAAARLKEHARAAGISVSELTRRRADNKPPPVAAAPELNRVAHSEYSRLASNLNQLVTHMNEQRVAGLQVVFDYAVLRSLIEKLTAENAALRADLLGASKRL